MTKVNLELEPGVNGKLIYYPGHLLKGVVELNLNSPKKFRGLHITIYGQARAHWTKYERRYHNEFSLFGNNRRRNDYHNVNYEGIEIYVNSRSYLFGQSGGPTFEMAAGIHRYEFACQLPPGIPYTVGLQHADIHYFVEAVLDIPWHFDKESKIPLIIIPYVDLNFYQHLRAPQNFDMYKNTCSLFCKSGRLQMTVYLPCTGFAVGQKVPIKFFYDNKSNVDVASTKMILSRITTYNAMTPRPNTKSKQEDVFVVTTGGCKDGKSTTFESIFEIPQVMLCTNDMFCRVVQITYIMKIEAVLGGLSSNLISSFPVVIGTVPVQEDQFIQNQFMAPEPSSYYPPCPDPYAQPSAPAFPPSFQEVTQVPEKQGLTLMENPMQSNFGWGM